MGQPYDPLRFLTVADELAEGSSDEARLRTAVGRAYYALFLVALDKTGLSRKGNPRHKEVLRKVKDRDRGTGEKLATLLRVRASADYRVLPDPRYPNWTSNWSLAKILVEDILPKIQSW